MSGDLQGKRVLLLEDDFLIASMAAGMLSDLGAVVVGPASRIDEAIALATKETLDVAVLDINIRGERSHPVAEALRQRSIPYVFATGYDEKSFSGETDALVLQKPYTDDKLAEVLQQALGLA